MPDYKSTPAIGQIDGNACWAACSSWWLKALGGGRPALTQMDLIVQYTRFCDDDGGMPPTYFLYNFCREPRFMMKAVLAQSAYWKDKPLPLGDRPTLVVFTYPLIGGTHMNVIFGQDKDSRKVTAMEPYHPYPGQDGKRSGTFVERSEQFYLSGPTFAMVSAST